jgi:hypothetical protein
MRHFDIKSKLFRLEALKGIDREKRIQKNKDELKANLDKLKNNLIDLEDSRKELEQEYYEKQKKISFSKEALENMSSNERNKYNKKREDNENDYLIEANKIRKKIFIAKKEIDAFTSKSVNIALTTPVETSRIFSLIIDDVYDAMGAVSNHYKVAFVFNSSAEISYIESGITIDNPMNSFLDKFEEIESSKDGKKVTAESLYAWISEKNSAFRNLNDRRLSAFVMKGGLNMTPAVIDYIYQKHKIGDRQRKFILEFFEKVNSNNFEW